jgi:hypothetical protein
MPNRSHKPFSGSGLKFMLNSSGCSFDRNWVSWIRQIQDTDFPAPAREKPKYPFASFPIINKFAALKQSANKALIPKNCNENNL